MNGHTPRARRWLAASVLLWGLATSFVRLPTASAQDMLALPGDPVTCPDGSTRGWTRFAGGPYPGRFSGARGVVLDADGNLIVADSENGRLQRLSPAGEPLGIIEIARERPDLLPSPEALAIDARGYLYVADSHYRRVVKLAPDGTVLATWRPDLVEGQTNVIVGPVAVGGGYLYTYFFAYGSRYASPPAVSQLKRIDLATGDIVMLDGASIGRANGMAADADGYLYVSEYGQSGGRIRKVSPTGDVMAVWDGGEEKLARPSWLTFGADSNLYAADRDGFLIRAFTRDGTLIGKWSSPNVYGIAVDRAGTIYAAHGGYPDGGGQIAKFAPSGELVARIGARSDTPGLLEYIQGVGIDPAGNVYAMTSPRRQQAMLHQFSPSGQLLGSHLLSEPIQRSFDEVNQISFTGDGGRYVLGGEDGPGEKSSVLKVTATGEIVGRWQAVSDGRGYSRRAHAFLVAPDETVYITDEISVYKIGPDGRQQARWMAEDVDRWAPRGRGFTATALALDAEGNLYVGGQWYTYKLGPDGSVLARWGSVPEDPYRTGSSMFARIRSLAVDAAGNVYVSQSGTPSFQLLGPDGTVLATWGRQSDQQRPLLGEFPGGSAITIDQQGNVYTTTGREIWRLACGSPP